MRTEPRSCSSILHFVSLRFPSYSKAILAQSFNANKDIQLVSNGLPQLHVIIWNFRGLVANFQG